MYWLVNIKENAERKKYKNKRHSWNREKLNLHKSNYTGTNSSSLCIRIVVRTAWTPIVSVKYTKKLKRRTECEMNNRIVFPIF